MESDLCDARKESGFKILSYTFSKRGFGGGVASSWSSIANGKGRMNSFVSLRLLYW